MSLFEGLLLPKLNKEGAQVTEQTYRSGSTNSRAIDIISPDLCNQCSWWQQSSQVTRTLTTADNLTYTSPEASDVWIDAVCINAQEGRYLMPDGTFKYRADFKAEFTEGDVPIDFSDIESINFGKTTTPSVTFNTSKSGVVKFVGSKVAKTDRFLFIVAPKENVEIVIEHAEIQYAVNVIHKPVRFEILIGAFGATPVKDIPLDTGLWDTTYYDTFAYHPNPDITEPLQKHLGSRQDYLRQKDFEELSNVGKNTIPAWGDRNWAVLEFPFNYSSSIPLDGNSLVGMRFYGVDVPGESPSTGAFTGNFASITLYTLWNYDFG